MTPPTPAILALVSAPLVDLSGKPVPLLKADRELATLESWLSETGCTVELTVEWAEAERLQRALLRRRFDVLHYTGHGSQEALAFEDGRGGLHALTADQLAALVCPSGELAFRLAFLSACHSAKLAAALLDAGVPHVVAVDPKESVTDQAAAAFARAFYAAMLAGQSVTSAFAQGRTRVYTDPDLDRIGRERSMSDLAEREARKFRLLPRQEEGGDHSAPLFPAGLPSGKVVRHDPPSTPHQLGARPETFTGRQRELHQLVGYLLDNRLTVLTGMGGMGKLAAALDFLGGWPLALVLAAPLLADYSLAELYRRLEAEKDQLLADPTLLPEARDKLDSVDASLSLSYAHLEQAYPEAARVFPLLALFPGGADEVAIRAILGPEALDAVARLRAASLVEEAGDTRVRLPGPAHAYAERRLPPDARDQYGPPGVAYYLALIKGVGEVPLSHESGLSLAVTLNELPNLHAFADWGLAQEGETAAQAARLVGSLRNLYMLLAWPEEGTARLRRAVDAAQRADDAWAEANTLQAIGDVQRFRDEYDDALHLFQAVGDRLGEANTLLALAPSSENAEEVFRIALSLYEAIGDQYSPARGLYYYAQFLASQGQTDKTMAALEQCRDKFLAIHLTDLAAAAQQAINELSDL